MTTRNPVTFATFSRALAELGFAADEVDVDGPRVVFRHPATDTIVTVNPMRAQDPVPERHLISARYVLPARGVTTEAHWDEHLEDAAASRA